MTWLFILSQFKCGLVLNQALKKSLIMLHTLSSQYVMFIRPMNICSAQDEQK